jgi:ATP-dependent exoDNAse (exonuclease V) alpha subunit
MKVNEKCMKRFLSEKKPTQTLSYEPLKYDKNSQDITICDGMPVIARVNQKSMDIVNNEVFTITNISSEIVTVSNELKHVIQIPADKFNKLFYLAFCITIHKSQGCTFDEKYTIYEWNKQDRKMKYVALSRATDEKNIQILL